MTGRLDARIVLDRGEFSLDVELGVEPDQTVAILGPNGAGKSTIVAALAGLLRIGDGEISLGGRMLDSPKTKVFVSPEVRGVGVVFQNYLLFERMTVAENVGFGPACSGLASEERERLVSSLLQRFELASLGERRAGELSGGEAQRVALARALASEPRLLVLDEPTASLDATARTEVRRRLVDDLASFPGPRLLITHDPLEAFLLADVIYVVEKGRVTQSGTVDEIRLRPKTSYAADLVGSNLVLGFASNGDVDVDGFVLHTADSAMDGDVVATVHPRAIAVYPSRPEGSPRNTWETTIEVVEHYGDRVRLLTGSPLPLTVEITPDSADSLGLEAGSGIWLSIKATEIVAEPA